MNLRHGMFLALGIQSVVIGFDFALAYMNMSKPSLQTFFFAKGVDLSGPAIILWITGLATLIVGALALPKRSSPGTVRLWMVLSFILVPIQMAYGGLYSYRCMMIYMDLTPSMIATNTAMQIGMGMMMKELGGGGMGSVAGLGGPPEAQTKKDAAADFNKRFPEGQKFQMDFFDKSSKEFKDEPPKSWFGGVKKWFKEKGKNWSNYLHSKTGVTKNQLVKGFLLAVVVAGFITGATANEYDLIYPLLPDPINAYYKAGFNFMQTFGLRGFLFVIAFLVIAIHISAYSAVKARGGTGDECVSYNRIRWFYSQPGEVRRKIRAGANTYEMRTADKNIDSDDSGSDLEEVHEEDKVTSAVVADKNEAKRHRKIKI